MNEMGAKAKSDMQNYEEETIERGGRLMMHEEENRGKQREEKRYLATERTLRLKGYLATGNVSSALHRRALDSQYISQYIGGG